MLDIPMFWLGPLGRMIPLACPEQGLSNSVSQQAAQNATLSMRRVLDIQGYRREWSMNQAYLDPEDVSALEAMFMGFLMPPHRFIDPLKRNRLRPSVSAPRRAPMWNGGVGSWELLPGSGTIIVLEDQDYETVSYVSEGDAREVSYQIDSGLSWNSGGAGSRLYPNGGPLIRPHSVDPILPGETLTLSFWMKMTGTGTFTFSLYPVNASMVTGTPEEFEVTSSTWQQYTITYTAPVDGTVVGLYPLLATEDSDVSLQLGRAQLEAGDVVNRWEPGYGAPEVAITNLDTVSPRFPLITASLTITEL